MEELETAVPFSTEEALRLIGNAASGALEARGYDRATLEFIERLVWTILPTEWRQPMRVHRADAPDFLASVSTHLVPTEGRHDHAVSTQSVANEAPAPPRAAVAAPR